MQLMGKVSKRYRGIFMGALAACIVSFSASAQVPEYLSAYKSEYEQDPRAANLHWFRDAQFGMFIHYGLYSIPGKGEWVQLLDTIPLHKYALLKDQFTAKGFDANAIVKLAKKAGMKYITITTKHHDGFCLFKTEQTAFNSVNSPAKRDLIGEMAKACEAEGLGLFLYYSYAADWRHPYFYSRQAGWKNGRPPYKVTPAMYKYRQPADFRRYINFVHRQLKELLTQYPTVAGIWLDPVMGYYAAPEFFPVEETYALIRSISPHALISFKQGANGTEDFVAPERNAGARVGELKGIAAEVYEKNKNKPREVCNTMQPVLPGMHGGASWGYNKAIDGHHLTAGKVRRLLADARAKDYNLLLNIGPLPDGSVHPEDIKALSELNDPLPYADYFKLRNGLPAFYKKLEEHLPVTVAFLGGSITYNPGWRDRVCKYLEEKFPETKFRFIAAGIPSLGSVPHAFRLQQDVLDSGKIDLLFVEAAVNDRSNGTDSVTQIRCLDGIVRHTKRNNPGVDIIFMSFADPAKLKDYSEGRDPVEVKNHELVAQYYLLPSIDLARTVYDKITAGEFSWEGDFKDLHPSPFGQRVYFESMKALLEKCLSKAQYPLGLSVAKALPPPMNEFSIQNGRYLPVSAAKVDTGFRLIENWQPSDGVATRKGFVNIPVLEAVTPGSQLTLRFRGTAIGMAILSGPDAGNVEYSIDDQPFRKFNQFTRWSDKLYLPRYTLFSGNLKDGKHVLRLQVASDKDTRSKGTASRIVYFLVNDK